MQPVKKQYPSGVEVYTTSNGDTYIGVFGRTHDLTSTEAEVLTRDLQDAAKYVRKISVRKKKLGDH